MVVGGGAAGIFGAIRAKDVSPHLRVVVIEKGKLLSKVKLTSSLNIEYLALDCKILLAQRIFLRQSHV